jgi:chorismate mutase
MHTAAGDTSAGASSNEEPPPQDGWRGKGLPRGRDTAPGYRDGAHPERSLADLRGELDRIDNVVHDLLIERAKVVERVALAGKPAAFRPGREASILRRLVGRHRGSLPAASLVRIWRELLAGTTAMQGRFSLAVCDADPGAALTQLTREHFGALTPLHQYGSTGQALAEVRQGAASVAVLPFPSDSATWWIALAHHEPRLSIIGRLPFWRNRPDGAPSVEALVVANTPPDASGDDRSFLSLECDSDVSRTRLGAELSAAGLVPEMMLVRREQGATTAHVLAEVNGLLADQDPRLNRLGNGLRRPVVIGGYAVPLAEPG